MPDSENPDNTGELHESPLSPADDERIRRLLAEARHTDPMPDVVVARLDRVLAGLSSDRAERAERDLAPVVELAARRRRTAANLLVAAAAVVAVGFGITQVLPNVGGGSDADTAQEATAGGDAAADSDGGDARSVSPESAPEAPGVTSGETAKSTFRIDPDTFGHDVRRVRHQVERDADAASLFAYPASGCLAAKVDPASTVVAATYDAAPAAVVLQPPSGDVQVVDLYLCGDVEPRRSITLTAP